MNKKRMKRIRRSFREPFVTTSSLLFLIAGVITLFYGIFVLSGFSILSLLFLIAKSFTASKISFLIGVVYFFLGVLLILDSYIIRHSRMPLFFGVIGLLIGVLTFNYLVILITFIAFIVLLFSW